MLRPLPKMPRFAPIWAALGVLSSVGLAACAETVGTESADVATPGMAEFALDLDYQVDEMLGFSIEAFLKANAEHLLSDAEVISHMAGEYRISPRALLAVMEQQSGALSDPDFDRSKPLGKLSNKAGLVAQLRDVAARLRQASENGDLRVLVSAPDESITAVIPKAEWVPVADVYRKLFPGVVSAPRLIEKAASPQPPMQFPGSVGESWDFGGAHGDDGRSFPLSSLDFHGPNNSAKVVAVAGGILKRHSSCYFTIIHSSNWMTGYYHVAGISVSDGATVKANQPISNYATTRQQALCEGGTWTGPHLHWTLYYANREVDLTGKVLSGWTIHAGTSNYDDDCSRMYMSRNGVKVCPYRAVRNDGIASEPPPPPPPPPPPAGSVTVTTIADSYVNKASPTNNFGVQTSLRTLTGTNELQALMRFSVPALSGTVTSAKLRVYVKEATSDGPRIFATSGAWQEGTVNWNNRPSASGAALANFGPMAAGWVEIDLTRAISTGGRNYDFLLLSDATDALDFASREGASKPQLVINVGGN